MRVLFVCTHNAARSQMAEAFARHYGADAVEAYSAGAQPTAVHPLTAAVLAERGLDISAQRAKGLDQVPAEVDLAVTVCDQAAEACPLAQAKRKRHWSLPDPTAAAGTPQQILAAFRAVRDDIEARVKALLEELRAETQ